MSYGQYKIVVVGLGYVGLSNAVLLAQHNEVIGVDISPQSVDALNARQSSISDLELNRYLKEENLNLSADVDLKKSLVNADFVIIATPTNYDEETNFFDTSSVEKIISEVSASYPRVCIVVKSTIPIGFIERMRKIFPSQKIIFSPEFLREGNALYDNLYPSRIVIGDRSEKAQTFARLLAQASRKDNVKILFTESNEAESIKLFSNTYLAMRVSFFNEIDTFARQNNFDCKSIIDGICLDNRIGQQYNNPSFGYGGYCLPKDTKQLLANYQGIPQEIITAIVKSNMTRKKFIVSQVVARAPRTIGIYKLAMKKDSDNYRESAILDIASMLKQHNKTITLYEPSLKLRNFKGMKIINNLNDFKISCDVILANRIDSDIMDVKQKIISSDIYGEN
jgi:UDPglucose 6-dehydrogenase